MGLLWFWNIEFSTSLIVICFLLALLLLLMPHQYFFSCFCSSGGEVQEFLFFRRWVREIWQVRSIRYWQYLRFSKTLGWFFLSLKYEVCMDFCSSFIVNTRDVTLFCNIFPSAILSIVLISCLCKYPDKIFPKVRLNTYVVCNFSSHSIL